MIFSFMVMAGLGLGLGLYCLLHQSSVQALSSEVPRVVTHLPENCDFVAYVDVRKILYSPVYQSFENTHGEKFAAELQDFIRETGMDPRKDLDSIVFASYQDSDGKNNPIAIVTGRFEPDKITSILTGKGNAQISLYRDMTLYGRTHTRSTTPNAGVEPTEVACFLDNANLLFGKTSGVQNVIDTYKNVRPGILVNQTFIDLFNQTSTESTFWIVSTNMNFLNRFQHKAKEGTQEQAQILPKFPSLNNFIMHGDLGSMIYLSMRTQCSSEKAAQNVNDFVRGMIALGKMTLEQKPEMAGILEDIQVTMENQKVSVDIRMPFEDLKKLHELHKMDRNPSDWLHEKAGKKSNI